MDMDIIDTLPDDPQEPTLSPSSSPALSIVETEDPPEPILKNTTIPVNVDDLDVNSGWIIVTFAHSSGSLYQGVLLQLNRDRGIPCGISFPKDYCSTSPSKTTENDEENEHPLVQQRHTYFLTNPTVPPKSMRRFNRATKPPARYKNGRLALRLRHRPVLCSKCKAYCEEINPKIITPLPDPLVDTGDGVTARRNNELKSKSSDINGGSTAIVEDSDDCSYTVVGPQTGIVENYWKRPIPVSHTVITDASNLTVTDADDTSKLLLSLKTASDNLISQDDSTSAETKRQNLRICINKLQLQKESESSPNPESDQDSIGRRLISRRGDYNSSAVENSRKRSTTVPARFRDDSVTRSVFDFKRRRQGGKTEIAESDSTPTPPRSPSIDASINGNQNQLLTPRRSLSLTPRLEVSRTPTIKISFGSSGKGVVIEIPSKPTVMDGSQEDSDEKSKAEKKALRKAKKQARRKLSRLDTIPEEGQVEGQGSLLTSMEVSSSHSSCSSPPPPLLTPISELCPLIIDEDFPTASLDQCPPLIHFTKEIPLSPKKRKKDKKHKKYKIKPGLDSDVAMVTDIPLQAVQTPSVPLTDDQGNI